jgi:hypothetical protein
VCVCVCVCETQVEVKNPLKCTLFEAGDRGQTDDLIQCLKLMVKAKPYIV